MRLKRWRLGFPNTTAAEMERAIHDAKAIVIHPLALRTLGRSIRNSGASQVAITCPHSGQRSVAEPRRT